MHPLMPRTVSDVRAACGPAIGSRILMMVLHIISRKPLSAQATDGHVYHAVNEYDDLGQINI